MSYCTKAQLITAFGENELIQSTDRDGLGVVDDTVLASALARADAEINRRLRAKGHALPLTEASADLQELALDLTRFYLHGHLTEIPANVQAAFDRAIKTLDNYVRGTVAFDLPLPGGNDVAAPSAGDVAVLAKPRIFDDEAFHGFG